VAFNDHAPGARTAANATRWSALVTASSMGPLKDIQTGENLPVTLAITRSGTVMGANTQGTPATGTPVQQMFGGFVDFQGTPNPSVELVGNGVVTYTFTGLDPARQYRFHGSAIRGNPGYTNRWTLCELTGAESAKGVHSAGVLTTARAPALTGNQAALNTGINHTASTGDLVGWDEIVPGTDGSFAVVCSQYQGTVPGGSSTGPRGYALTGIRLEEVNVEPSAPSITTEVANRTVDELEPATFSVVVTGNPRPTLQWYRNDAAIEGATEASLAITEAKLADDGARFKVVASNASGSANSTGVLTVRADTTPPRVLEAGTAGLTSVRVGFSERLAEAPATDTANYTLSGGGRVISAVLDGVGTGVVLRTEPLVEGATYVLALQGIADRSAAANRIVAGTTVTFVALAYVPRDIGGAAVGGSVRPTEGGYDVTAGGTGIVGASDGLFLASQPTDGDFDIEARVAGIGASDVWARAGLMARVEETPGSAFAAVFATPSVCGTFFESRATAGASAQRAGAFPANFPHGWLRLRREGARFSGYASTDGRRWELLGTTTLNVPPLLHVGLATTSQSADRKTTAWFRDLGTSEGDEIGRVELAKDREPAGPSSRKTGLVITEIMYRPVPRTDARNLEFVELFNSNPFPEDIGGYRLAGDVGYEFPAGTTIPGGGFLVVARNPEHFRASYQGIDVMGPYAGSLGDSATVRLRNQIGAIYLEFTYRSRAPWPAGARATGHSLVLARPSYGEADPRAWDWSEDVGGSPGRVDGRRMDALRTVVINEILANSDGSMEDYVELYHRGAGTLDLSGCVLTDDATTNKFVIPPGTRLGPGAFVSYRESQLGFALSAAGEALFLKSPDGTRLLDAIRFEGQDPGVASGRSPDGGPDFRRLRTRTPGEANGAAQIDDVVINEIMYQPISENPDDQYLELHNKGTAPVNLGGWRLEDGIEFSFPDGTLLAPGGYLVVARNRTNLLAKHTTLSAGSVTGDFEGRLSGQGERIALSRPALDASRADPDAARVTVTEVTYSSGGRWGRWANGGGSSLELVDARADARLASNWADSDESGKAPWTEVSATGVMDLGSSYAAGQNTTPVNRLEASLFGEGECLLDAVEVTSQDAANRVANSSFEGGLTGWTPQGNHVRSGLETGEGYQSGQSLRLRASSRGDPSPNRVRTALNPALTIGQTVTIRARARWLRGWPEVLLRLKGNYFEAVGRLEVPSNLGTPGARNSRTAANVGPAIHSVRHDPALPAANEPVVVSARVQDPDGVASARLIYRLDPSGTSTSVDLRDDGTGGDGVAKDGVWSATIPGQASGALVAFHVLARDGQGTGLESAFPDDAPGRECLVRFGETDVAGSFGVYRQWFTQAAVNSWINRPVLSNERVEGTFVYGNFRAVYNFGSRYAGSPYHQNFPSPTSNCHYSIEMPRDDRVLGTENFNKVHAPGNGPFDDNTHQREQTAYWLVRQLNVPWNYRRYVVMYVNGNRRGQVMEDAQTPGSEVVEEYFPDDAEGELFKLQPWFEFDDGITGNTGFNNKAWCTLNNYLSGGQKKTARYRWNFLRRAARSTANDYTRVFELVDAANQLAPGDYVTNMETLVDVEEWMRIFAVEHAVGNWDSFGYRNSQNMYGYKPERGRWSLMIWDFNIVLGNSGSDGPNGQNLFNVSLSGQDQGAMSRFYATPPFRRAYLRGLQDLADGPMQAGNVGAVMDAKYRAFMAEGLTATSPEAVKTWIATMRQSILSAVATQGGTSTFSLQSASGGEFVAEQGSVVLVGTAPATIKTLEIGGVEFAPRWTTISNWTISVPVAPGSHVWIVRGLNSAGIPLAGAERQVRVTNQDTTAPAVVINEVVSRNTGGILNCGLRYDDWIELYNPSDRTVDLAGFSLTDSLTDPRRWVFPTGARIEPRAYLLIWADGGENECQDNQLHATFRLSADGEELGFFGPDGKLLDSVVIPQLGPDQAVGRDPDGTAGTWRLLERPSPSASNAPDRLVVTTVRDGTGIRLRWTSAQGATYRIEFTENLGGGIWQRLGTDIVSNGGTTETPILVGGPSAFYRVVRP